MKALRTTPRVLIAVILTAGMIMNFTGCSKELPFQSGEAEQSRMSASLTTFRSGEVNSLYPQVGSKTYRFWTKKDKYWGGKFFLPNGTSFQIKHGDLIPPPEYPWGDDLTITMKCNKDDVQNQLLFDFGPAGCRFNRAAKIVLDWSDLDSSSETPMLYYIDDNGTYIEQTPAAIDTYNKKMKIYIDHFSRYAIAFKR